MRLHAYGTTYTVRRHGVDFKLFLWHSGVEKAMSSVQALKGHYK